MLGPIGREIFGLFYWLHITAVAGSGLLSFSVALNAVSVHATCTGTSIPPSNLDTRRHIPY